MANLYANSGADGSESLPVSDATREQVRVVIGQALPRILSDVLGDTRWRTRARPDGTGIDVTAPAESEVVRAKRKTMRALNLSDTIEDILITLQAQYHIVSTADHASFVRLVLDETRTNLEAAGHELAPVSEEKIREELDRIEIERRSGDHVDEERAALRLGIPKASIRQKVGDGELVAYRVTREPDELRLPLWQFDDDGGVHPWVRVLTEAFGGNGWGLIDFVTVPRTSLDGRSYLDALTNGSVADIERICEAARRSNPD